MPAPSWPATAQVDEATGNPQPSYRLDYMKIWCEFPKLKGDEGQEQDNVERKQARPRLTSFSFFFLLFVLEVQRGTRGSSRTMSSASRQGFEIPVLPTRDGRMQGAHTNMALRLVSPASCGTWTQRLAGLRPLLQELTATKALEILKRIPEEDCK